MNSAELKGSVLDYSKAAERLKGVVNRTPLAYNANLSARYGCHVYLKREEECVAACCGAPVVVINGHYHEKLTAAKVDELLDGLK